VLKKLASIEKQNVYVDAIKFRQTCLINILPPCLQLTTLRKVLITEDLPSIEIKLTINEAAKALLLLRKNSGPDG